MHRNNEAEDEPRFPLISGEQIASRDIPLNPEEAYLFPYDVDWEFCLQKAGEEYPDWSITIRAPLDKLHATVSEEYGIDSEEAKKLTKSAIISGIISNYENVLNGCEEILKNQEVILYVE